jgi:hypothetical protein
MFTQLWFDYSHITSNTEDRKRGAIVGVVSSEKGNQVGSF